MPKLLQLLLLGALALTAQSAAVARVKAPEPTFTTKVVRGGITRNSTQVVRGGVTTRNSTQVVRVGFAVPEDGDEFLSQIRFFEHNEFQGEGSYCIIYEYNQCYTVSTYGTDPASSLIYYNQEIPKEYSLTFYTGNYCDGQWFRYSGYMKQYTYLAYGTLAGFNDKLRSYKIANFPTSTTTGYQIPKEYNVQSVCF